MKSILTISILATFLSLTACTNEQRPDKVANKFLNAIGDQQFNKAKKFSTERTAAMLEVVESLSKIAPESNTHQEYEIIDYSIDGKFATVIYKAKGSAIQEELRLVKEDEEWKVGSMPEMQNNERISNI